MYCRPDCLTGINSERRPWGGALSGLRGDNYSRINTPEIFTVLMQTMNRQTIIMQRVHHVLVVAFHLLM